MKVFSEKLLELRRREGLSQEQLADQLRGNGLHRAASFAKFLSVYHIPDRLSPAGEKKIRLYG